MEENKIFRKRNNFFACGKSQKISNKKLICQQTESLSDLSSTMGLKINEIILSPENSQQKTLQTCPICNTSPKGRL
jgi:hypothetical protein